jgi:DNA-directed RNA polymerase specialized sigma24 family protein
LVGRNCSTSPWCEILGYYAPLFVSAVKGSESTARRGTATVTRLRYDLAVASDPPAMNDGLSAFERARPRLFGIAYRMLGSAAEAEDVVQDVWTRWQSTDRRVIRDPQAFLATTTTRLAINVLQSARARHETYVGPWLPEPVDTSADPGLGAERGEAL